MDQITASQLKELLLFTAARLIAAKDELCAIDAAIGDGDHGLGMAQDTPGTRQWPALMINWLKRMDY